MKTVALIASTLLVLGATLASAETSKSSTSGLDRFYGRITALDRGSNTVTVHNKKQNLDSKFVWDDQTLVVLKQKSIPSSDLKVGQSLMVAFVADGQVNRAKKITVRTDPAHKSKTENPEL